MIYLEHQAGPPLAPWVRKLWYVRAPEAAVGRERVLPNGDTQIVINLARDFCTGFAESGATFRQAPALLVGVRNRYGVIDSSDLAEMIGVVFTPGGLRRFVAESAMQFRFAESALDDVWGRSVGDLRGRISEATTIEAKFCVLERELLGRLRLGVAHPALLLALDQLRRSPSMRTVRELSARTGYSSRRLGQLFEDEVGVGPKMFSRILRFQRAAKLLYAGSDMRWDELALECGYCDQSHFANDFRAFSGMNPMAYSRHDGVWANHIPE